MPYANYAASLRQFCPTLNPAAILAVLDPAQHLFDTARNPRPIGIRLELASIVPRSGW
jgi:hypothetical protein